MNETSAIEMKEGINTLSLIRKNLTLRILILFVSLSFVPVLFAQRNIISNSRRVVIINKYAFEDSQAGITEIIEANHQLDLGECFGNISKQDRERRSKILFDPVKNKISQLFNRIENEDKITILDGVELEEKGQLLAFDEKLDITKQFISFFNSNHRAFEELTKLDFSQSRVTVINSKIFFEKTNGINIFINAPKINTSNNYCADAEMCLKISNAINTFAKTKGYSFILDSGKELPEKISKLQPKDVTQEFISEFNKNN